MTRSGWLVLCIAALTYTRSEIFSQVPAGSDTNSVAISYNERTASDPLRAVVARLIIEGTPVGSWPEYAVPNSFESRELAILERYKYYRSEYPVTTQLLIDAIDSANATKTLPHWGGRTLKVPPVPIRGHTLGAERIDRFYDVNLRGYGIIAGAKSAGGKYVHARVDSLPPPVQKDTIRSGVNTTVLLDIPKDFLNRAKAIVGSVNESELNIQDAGGIIPIELYGHTAVEECDVATQWLNASPFRNYTHSRLAGMTNAARSALSTRARSSPLTIVDWNFQNGHGRQVKSVVFATLQALGLSELFTSGVKVVDLEPTTDTASLNLVLDNFRDYLLGEGAFDKKTEEAWTSAKLWLKAPTGPGPAYSHEQLLKAVFWKYIESNSGVANFSFGLTNPVFNLRPPKLGSSSGTAFFAAGNSPTPLDGSTSLQNLGSIARPIVTVTAATNSGNVVGNYSDPYGLTVTLAGPACGFSGDGLSPNETGSSLSSPFVATVAWVARLLDPNHEPELRGRLLMATMPLPRLNHDVAADGLFDPWLLLAWPSLLPTSVLSNGTIATLDSMRLDADIAPMSGSRFRTTLSNRTKPPVNGGIAVARNGGQTSIWWRSAPDMPKHWGVLMAVSGYVGINGAIHRINRPEDLAQVVRSIWY
jgi:hypothetical protein